MALSGKVTGSESEGSSIIILFFSLVETMSPILSKGSKAGWTRLIAVKSNASASQTSATSNEVTDSKIKARTGTHFSILRKPVTVSMDIPTLRKVQFAPISSTLQSWFVHENSNL